MTDRFRSILSWIARIGLFLVPFIPLYVSRVLFFPYITGKAFIFRSVMEIVFIAWLPLAFFYKEFRPSKTPLLWALGIFIGIVVLATVFGANPYRSFWSNYERMDGLIAYLHLAVYFLVLSSVFHKKDWLIFFNLFVLSGLIQNIYALLQKLGFIASLQGGFRVDGTIGNPTYVAAYLIFVLAACSILLLSVKNKVARYFYGCVALFSLLTIYFTATRGVILALFAGALMLGILYLWRGMAMNDRERWAKRMIAAVLIILILSAVGLKVFRASKFVKKSEILSRLASISLSEGKSRFLIWNMGWRGFLERPILGWGPENYNLIFATYYNPKLFTQEPWFDRSHNIIFDWLINAGILGFLSYLGMFSAALYLMWRSYLAVNSKNTGQLKSELYFSVLISTLLFIYFFQNIFVFDQLATYLGFFAVLAYIQSSQDASRALKPGGAPKNGSPRFDFAQGGAVAAGIAVLIPMVYFLNYKPLAANINLIKAMQFGGSGDLEKSFTGFEQAFSYKTLGNSEIGEQFAQFTISVVQSNKVSQDFKQKVFEKAVLELKENVKANPYDPRAHLFLGAVYRSGGMFDESVAAFKEALRLAPAKQQIYFELGDTYFRKGDYSEAVKTLETAFYLEPQFDEARMNLVAAHILNNEQAKADALLTEGYGKVDVAESILTQVYLAKKNYERLVGVWSAFVETNPHKIEYYKNLATAYLALAKQAEAIRVLETAIKINPEFKEEGESYILEIKGAKPK